MMSAQSDTPTPMFSIVVPAYNVERYLDETLASLLAQDFEHYEVVVCNDGSTDSTLQIAERFAREHARLRVVSQENGGCSAALNTAIANSRGEYICICGADDLYLPQYLSSQAAFIAEHPGYDIYSCNGINRFPDGHDEPYHPDARHQQVTSFVLEDWFINVPVFGLATLRKDLLDRLGGYRTKFRNAEDYDFWLRAMSSGATHIHNPATLGVYRRHPTSKSSNVVKAANAVLAILEDLDAHGDLTPDQREKLQVQIRRRRVAVRRREMEARFREGDYRHGRRDFLASREGYFDQRKYWMVAPLAVLSPRLYTRVVLRRGIFG